MCITERVRTGTNLYALFYGTFLRVHNACAQPKEREMRREREHASSSTDYFAFIYALLGLESYRIFCVTCDVSFLFISMWSFSSIFSPIWIFKLYSELADYNARQYPEIKKATYSPWRNKATYNMEKSVCLSPRKREYRYRGTLFRVAKLPRKLRRKTGNIVAHQPKFSSLGKLPVEQSAARGRKK